MFDSFTTTCWLAKDVQLQYLSLLWLLGPQARLFRRLLARIQAVENWALSINYFVTENTVGSRNVKV
jgi:hypothetical protein